jgi:hypothetical protein
MKHISILVPKKAILGSLEGSRQLLTQVNEFMKEQEAPPVFKVQLVGLSKETPLSGGLFTANADALLEDVKKTDLIIIPAIDGEIQQALENNKEFIPWGIYTGSNRVSKWKKMRHTLGSGQSV